MDRWEAGAVCDSLSDADPQLSALLLPDMMSSACASRSNLQFGATGAAEMV